MNNKVQSGNSLSWESSFEIALALRSAYPKKDLEDVSLGNIFQWTIALPNFQDEPELANDAILEAIYQEWFEEINPL